MSGVTTLSHFKYRGYIITAYSRGDRYFVRFKRRKGTDAVKHCADTPIKARLAAERTINEWVEREGACTSP